LTKFNIETLFYHYTRSVGPLGAVIIK